MIYVKEFIKGSIWRIKFLKKIKKKHNKIKERKTHTRSRLVPNHHTSKKLRKIKNHEKKAKSKLIAHQDHQFPESAQKVAPPTHKESRG
jgi:hypothetical protein